MQRHMRPKRECAWEWNTLHKWGRMQEIEPNDSQMHSHFGGYTCVKVLNSQSLNWKGKQTLNWVPKIQLKKSWNVNVENAITLFI
jgi:hypothetical protein